MTALGFADWCAAELGQTVHAIPHLERVFEIAVLRIECSAGRRVSDPIAVMSNTACASSRRVSAEMLQQVGFSQAQIRITRRLLAGSTPRWPGLLRLFVTGASLNPAQQQYVLRQLRALRAAADSPDVCEAVDGRGAAVDGEAA